MGITNESKEALKAATDIVDVVSETVTLRKAGANYKGRCPFHGEKTPSFVVSPSKQIYHCFGCGVGGDVFKFVQETQRISFPEAVEWVADRQNFTLQYEGGGGERVDYSRVMDVVQGYFVSQLRDADLAYLKGRGLRKKTIRDWGIGYAPRSPVQLKYLEAQLLPMDQLQELSIIKTGERGRYAQFTDRITFPIRDHRGKVVGWSGRSLRGDIKAKYLNSSDSKLFNKSRILYGWDMAKEHIYQKRFVIIMEGQLDVILSHQAGIQTAVSTQGTALTEQHLPMIRKAGAKVLLAYDGDKAGRAAAYKAAHLLSTHGIAGGVVLMDEGEDPADMIADGRAEELKQRLRSWTELPRYVLEQIVGGYRLDDPYAKSAAVKACRDYLASLGDDVVMGAYVGAAAALCGVDAAQIEGGSTPVPEPSAPEEERYAAPARMHPTTEEILLYTMATHPERVDTAVDIVEDAAWQDQEAYRALLSDTPDDVSLSGILLREGIAALDDAQFIEVLRTKQRSYLLGRKRQLFESGAGMEVIEEINDRIRRMM